MHNSISNISKNITFLRESLGLTQKDFSELAKISPATLVNIESRKKSFRLKSLETIIDLTGITLEQLTKDNFILTNNIREKLIKKYKDNLEIAVILNSLPTLQYSIKHKLLRSNFLNTPKEINEIKIFFEKIGYYYKGNSIHTALKRMPDLIEIRKHESKGNTNIYLKKTVKLS